MERYYWNYKQRAIRIDTAIKAFLVIVSLTNVAGLWVWNSLPKLWTVIACVAQVISASAYLFPQSEQVTSINYLLPELQSIQNRVDHDWESIRSGELADNEINDLILQYSNELILLENKYTNGVSFPSSKGVQTKAEEEAAAHKFSYLDVSQTDHLEEAINNGK